MQNRPDKIIADHGHTLVIPMGGDGVEVPGVTYDLLKFDDVRVGEHDPYKHYILGQAALACARSSVNGGWPDVYVQRMRGAFASVLSKELKIPTDLVSLDLEKSPVGRHMFNYAFGHVLSFLLEKGEDIDPERLVVATERKVRLVAAGVFDDLDTAVVNGKALQERIDRFYEKTVSLRD